MITGLNCDALTKEELIERFIIAYSESKYREYSFNKRLFEPFHLLSVDNNSQNLNLITDNTINYYLHKPECFYCTGPWLIRPMGCYKTNECKLNFRYDKTSGRTFIETRQNKNVPNSIYMSRYILVANYFYSFPVIVRTPQWLHAILHHINEDPFDDNFGNHTFVDLSVHTGSHTKIRNIDETISKINLCEYEQNEQALNLLKYEKQTYKSNLVNSKAIFETIYFMKNNFIDLIKIAQERIDKQMMVA